MRKSTILLGMLSVFGALVSCTKEIETVDNTVGTHTVTVSSIQTKTAIIEGDSSVSFGWSDGDEEYFHLFENGVEGTEVIKTVDKEGLATFEATFSDSQASTYNYSAAYYKTATNKGYPRVQVEQTPTISSFDPAADVLLSVEDVISEGAPATDLQFSLGRPVSINRMNLVGLDTEEKVKSVEITADKSITGYYNIEEDTFTGDGKKITLTYKDEDSGVLDDGTFPVYFVCMPSEEVIISLRVTTDKNVYERNDIARPITFTRTSFLRFGVQMEGHGTPISADVLYTPVTSSSLLVAGAKYVIAGQKDGVYYAAGNQGSNNRPGAEVTINDEGKLVLNNTSTAHSFTLGVNGGQYTFLEADGDSGYLYAAGTKTSGTNYLRSKTTLDDDCYWTISFEDGAVKDVKSVNNSMTPYMRFNTSSTLFACYNTASQSPILLYVDESTLDITPGFSVQEVLEVPCEGGEYSIDVSRLSFDGAITVTVPDACDWITADNVAENATSFALTVSANAGEARSATLTLAAEGVSPSTITVNQAKYEVEKGTLENPFTPAEALAEIDKLEDGASTSDKYYVKGTVSDLDLSVEYGNATFKMGDLTVYRTRYFDGELFTSEDQLANGDVVVVYGNLQKYVKNEVTTPEISNGSIVEINGKTKLPELVVSAEGNDDEKTVTVYWNNVGADKYLVVCGTQSYTAGASEASHTFTMSDYGTFNITVTASKEGYFPSEGATVVTLTDPSLGVQEYTDVLNRDLTGVTGTSYTEWSSKTATNDGHSAAVYAGQSAGGYESIQIRSSNSNSNSGIITTASGGKLKKVVVTWNSNTASGRTLNVYGSKTAYSAATDLYNSEKQGTLLGTIVCGTSTELTVTGDYTYIGLRSASGAMYLTAVDITWEK